MNMTDNNTNTTDNKTTVIIDSSIAPKIREWINTGRGVKVWENAEIASGAACEVFTPGDVVTSPNWRYPIGRTIEHPHEDITVTTFEPVNTFRGRFKAMYWGPWVAKVTEAKAQRLCRENGLAENSWRWEYDIPGYVLVTIGRTTKQTFGEWEQNN